MSSAPDPVPGWIAALDQGKVGLPFIADYVRAIYLAFREEGFTDEQSLQLAIEQWRFTMADD